MNYCDPHRHSLSTIPASTRPSLASAHDSSCCRFPRVDAPEHVGYQVGPHRVRTTAQRLWLWGSLQRRVVPCDLSLELSRDLGFPRVPRLPAFASGARRITAASSALLCRTGFRCCHTAPVRDFYSLSHMSGPNPLARSAVFSSPSTSAACRRTERVERSIPTPSSRSDVASPIRGTTLRRKLGPRWRREPYRSGGPMCPFGRLYSAAWRAARWSLSSR
jgi:hypothetical protein